MLGTVIITVYTAVVRPFEDAGMNRQEIINEISVTFATYMLYAYTDLFTDLNDLVMMGWVSIGIMMCNILVNVLIMGCNTASDLKLRCRRTINRCKGKLRARKLR